MKVSKEQKNLLAAAAKKLTEWKKDPAKLAAVADSIRRKAEANPARILGGDTFEGCQTVGRDIGADA